MAMGRMQNSVTCLHRTVQHNRQSRERLQHLDPDAGLVTQPERTRLLPAPDDAALTEAISEHREAILLR